MASIIGSTRGLNRSLDQISSGIYENAVGLHRQEHRQLARWAAMIELREKVADLREWIDARQTYSKTSIPAVIWPTATRCAFDKAA
jgi:hypothetical protein